jgi:hypothetical protein
MASTARGVSKNVSFATSAGAVDVVDLFSAGWDSIQGFWVVNQDATNTAYLATGGVTSAVNGDDSIPLLPRQWTWFTKPAASKAVPPIAVTGQTWSGIGATAACNVLIVADNGAWHPYR